MTLLAKYVSSFSQFFAGFGMQEAVAAISFGTDVEVYRILSDTKPWVNLFTTPGHEESGFFRDAFFSNFLFFGAGNSANDDVDIYVSADGTSFTIDMTITGQKNFTSSDGQFDGTLYIGSSPPLNSPQIWNRDGFPTWTLVYSFGADRLAVTSLNVGPAALYASVSGTTGNDAQVWKTLNGTIWTLVFTFPGRQFISSVTEAASDGHLRAAVYDSGVREIWRANPADDTDWNVEFVIPTTDVDAITTQMVNGLEGLYVALGNEGGTFLDAKVYHFDGVVWELSVDFNAAPFSDTRPTVTAIGFDGAYVRTYAATGSFTIPQSNGIQIYTNPYDNP